MGSVIFTALFAVFFGTSSGPAFGDEPAAVVRPAELTWEDCVKAALTSNPGLRAERFQLDAATSRRSAAFGGFLPRISASADAGDSGSGNNPDLKEIGADSWGARLTASQSLFSGFSSLADVRRNLASVRKQKAALQAASADTRSQLRRAFADLLYAQENIRLLENIAKRRGDNADLVRLRYEGGRENKGSSLRVDADARAAAFDVNRARRALSLSRRELTRVTGLGDFTPVSVVGTWEVPPPPDNPDIAGLAPDVPAVRQSLASTEEARAGLWSALSPFWPSVDASANIARSGPDWVPENRTWGAGLTVSYSLFNGARDANNALAARAEDRAARENLDAVTRATRVSLEDAYNAYLDAFENVGVRKQYLDAAQVRAEIGRAQYANGLLSFTQWDLIETELVDSERGYLSARREALYAEAAWNRSLGLELGK
jgi:outer membrane protein TolC